MMTSQVGVVMKNFRDIHWEAFLTKIQVGRLRDIHWESSNLFQKIELR